MTRNGKRWPIAALLVPVALVVGLIGFLVSIPFVNDGVARGLERQLLELPLPPNSELVASAAGAQRFAGAGNGMEYLGGLLLRSDLPPAQLEAFYAAEGERAGFHVGVTATSDPRVGRKTELFRGREDIDLDAPHLYLVTTWGEAPSEWHRQIDLRGH